MKWFRLMEPTAETPDSGDEPGREIEDVLKEVQSILKNSRWGAREDPFRGFGSLPGRFQWSR